MAKQTVLTLILTAVFFMAAGSKAFAEINQAEATTFYDLDEPCIKIVFPDIAKYQGKSRKKVEEDEVVSYSFAMPAKARYDIRLVKRKLAENSIIKNSFYLAELYDNTLYCIEPGGLFPSKSATVKYAWKDGAIYLQSTMGEYADSDMVYYVVIERLVHKKEYVKTFNRYNWENSTTGRKFISEMNEFTDWFYENTETVSCEEAKLKKEQGHL